jgi:hypothetical protein
MGVSRDLQADPTPRLRARQMLLAGPLVVGWAVDCTDADPSPAADGGSVAAAGAKPMPTRPSRARTRPSLPRASRVAVAGAVVGAFAAGMAFSAGPEDARAPLVSPSVAAREQAQADRAAESARVDLLRHLQLAGIAARRVGPPAPTARQLAAARAKPFSVRPDDRAVALETYVQALGSDTILNGLDASRAKLQEQVLADPRLHIYAGGRDDVASGKVDVRILALLEYLAQADGSVDVSCLISGHSRYVHGRPGVVSAHVYGRAVDLSAVGGVPILGHQEPGGVTEQTILQILALPDSVLPAQVISLLALGGPSFALPDHYNHIHVGY